jgi:NAD kinase
MSGFEKVVLVVRKTRLAELIERFNTHAQARFYLTQAGLDFADYQREDDAYRRSLDVVRSAMPEGVKVQQLDRALVPTYLFAKTDVVVTLGQDGVVANTAKYVGAQPLIGVNPDPERFDGVLLPFSPATFSLALSRVMEARATVRQVTLAEARLSDGQRLLAFNDLFLGAASHVSARYRLDSGAGLGFESQSSSGVIVSTGAGSTGWLSSIFTMAGQVASLTGGKGGAPITMAWEDEQLVWVVREPYVSRHSSARQTAGVLAVGKSLKLESLMPSGGVVFSDGMEADSLAFNSGVTVEVRPASQRAQLVVQDAR